MKGLVRAVNLTDVSKAEGSTTREQQGQRAKYVPSESDVEMLN